METKLDFKIQTDKQLEVIGQGRMITSPCQVGEWWVTPAQDYQGKIPPEVFKRMFEIINSRQIEVVGVLIAEDMREIERKRELEAKKRELEEQKAEARREAGEKAVQAVGSVFKITGTILLAMIALPFMIFDPMCVLVCDDGRWVCCGTWYD